MLRPPDLSPAESGNGGWAGSTLWSLTMREAPRCSDYCYCPPQCYGTMTIDNHRAVYFHRLYNHPRAGEGPGTRRRGSQAGEANKPGGPAAGAQVQGREWGRKRAGLAFFPLLSYLFEKQLYFLNRSLSPTPPGLKRKLKGTGPQPSWI